jgi:hypothetical protein
MAEISGLVFLDHLGYTPVSQNVASVDQPVKHLCRLLDLEMD